MSMSDQSDLFVRAINASRAHVLFSRKRVDRSEALNRQQRIDELKEYIKQELLLYSKSAISFETLEQAKSGDTYVTGSLVVISEEEMKELVRKVFDLGYQEGSKNAEK
jgi:hypothetical protein